MCMQKSAWHPCLLVDNSLGICTVPRLCSETIVPKENLGPGRIPHYTFKLKDQRCHIFHNRHIVVNLYVVHQSLFTLTPESIVNTAHPGTKFRTFDLACTHPLSISLLIQVTRYRSFIVQIGITHLHNGDCDMIARYVLVSLLSQLSRPARNTDRHNRDSSTFDGYTFL